MKMVN